MQRHEDAPLRIIYSLLKPVIWAASRFRVPIRTLDSLSRLAYFEYLRTRGLSQAQVAERLGQSERHMRSLARRLKSDFFAAERDVGMIREVERVIAEHRPSRKVLGDHLPHLSQEEIDATLERLCKDERVVRARDGRYGPSNQYVLMSSEHFPQRIDALNHLLEGVYAALVQRLIQDDRETAMLKTISFTALPSEAKEFAIRLEDQLRGEIARMEERALFDGADSQRFTLGLTLAGPLEDTAAEVP